MKGLKKAIVAMALLAAALAWAEEPTTAPEPQWEVVSTDDGVVTERREWPDSPMVEFRGTTVIDARLSKIVSVLTDTGRKLEWIDRAVAAKDLQVFSMLERIEYNRSSAPWPVRDRDFVFRAQATLDVPQRTLFVTLKSVEHPDMPEQDCCVRGEITNSSYKLEALEDGSKTRVTVQILADPKGAVPKWIVNIIQKSWPRKTLQSLAVQSSKADVVEHAEYKTLFDKAQAAATATTSAL
mgnify:CR=1 FL=1